MNLSEKKKSVDIGAAGALFCSHCEKWFSVRPVSFKPGFTYDCLNCGGKVCLTRKSVVRLIHQMNRELAEIKKSHNP